MALYETLPVYKDVYALILLIYEVTKEFLREYKYTLGQDMKRDGMQLVRSIYRANKYQEKTVHLHQFQDDFELLKLEIRLCHDLRLINTRRYSELIVLTENIGRQVTGWRQYAEKQESRNS
ncbi:MAG: four helix bundle protein [Phaeodactylibacter sp.]|nr:four helix bundle protein [Phaeodactylibacter sp.]MCB9049310.1 four helix bundle protein [Lewinellaceae bacterium]